MRRALALAATPGFALGGNPRVGCVLLDEDGRELGAGYHRGAGTDHAEVDAIRAARTAGHDLSGATAVVTLEPCDHTGRTGPCSEALLEAGIARVVHAQSDPNPVATGGAARLRAAGVEVEQGLLAPEALALNRYWTFAVGHGRPQVTWKFAASLDGRSAAADGTSRWISSAAARRDAHLLRERVDTMLVGTGTLVADDPALTVRDAHDAPLPVQPRRAVMGLRTIPEDARVRGTDGNGVLHLATRDPRAALAELFAAGARDVLLEGGPHLAASFVRAGLVDEVVAYLAPVLLGAGPSAVADLGITTIAGALHLQVTEVTVLGDGPGTNLRLRMTPPHPAGAPTAPAPEERN